ncbi:MAG: type I methionyl aminopeptidase [Weeksellaceae bacterium]
MIHYKTPAEIETMKQGGKILRQVVAQLDEVIAAGKSTLEIDAMAEKLIREAGAEPSFQKVEGYSWTICAPINEQAVHTPPSDRVLQAGDVFTMDIGVFYGGFHTDYANTYFIGDTAPPAVDTFLKTGKETLARALELVKPGEYMGTLSGYIQHEIESAGYYILKDLTGHGVGRELHEDPYVLNYLEKPVHKTLKFKEGMTLAVEIIYSMGSEDIAYEKANAWSIRTKDKSLSACFEHTIAISDKNAFILT